MNGEGQPGPDPVPRMSAEQERARALAEVLRDQSERAEAQLRLDEERARWSQRRRGALTATWIVAAYVWIATPSWLTVEPPPQPTVAEEARALRLNVFLQSQAIEAYRRERGRLPYVLQEAGPPFRGMDYRRTDSRTYELHARTERILLRYHSAQSPLDFVGPSAGILDEGFTPDEEATQP